MTKLTGKPQEQLLRPEIKAFIHEHRNEDVHYLGLKKPPKADWPYALILDQIKARQKAAVKIPELQNHSHYRDMILPPPDILEQASSTATACYKAQLISGQTFIDLTGGAGVDSFAFAKYFKCGICVEHNENAAALINHNIKLLSSTPVDVQTIDAEDFVKTMQHSDLVYIDPQRRSNHRKGLYKLEDGQPNIIKLIPFIKQKTQHLMIKTAPMLDITSVLKTLDHVTAVHIIEWQGDCKEVLYLLNFKSDPALEDISITAVIVDDRGNKVKSLTFTRAEETKHAAPLHMPMRYIYEPGPAAQKSGGFNAIAKAFKMYKLHANTHLYTSDTLCTEFPGRAFEIVDILPVKREALKFNKANLSIRNFPSDVAALKKKLGLKDGGSEYLLACSLMDGNKVLLHCRKAL